MSELQYVGARYVPKFADPYEWQANTIYEPLTVVMYNRNSYTSKKQVPANIGEPTNNPEYWVCTGNYNAQIEEITNAIAKEISDRTNADSALDNKIEQEVTDRSNADSALEDKISAEVTARTEADSALEDKISDANPLFGKRIAVYGSSNEVAYYTENTNWVELLQTKLTGIASVTNKSVAGEEITTTIDRFISDNDRNNFDIVIFTSVRNAYKANKSFYDVANAMIKLVNNGNINQYYYFSSCLPFSDDINIYDSPMVFYDGLVRLMCGILGFKTLDMHNWLGIPNKLAPNYTTDGTHFKAIVQPKLAECAYNALVSGGEPIKTYASFKNTLDYTTIQGVTIVDDYIEYVTDKTGAPSDWNQVILIEADTDFNFMIRVPVKTKKEVPANTDIAIINSTAYSPITYTREKVHATWGTDVELQSRYSRISTLTTIEAGKYFILEIFFEGKAIPYGLLANITI